MGWGRSFNGENSAFARSLLGITRQGQSRMSAQLKWSVTNEERRFISKWCTMKLDPGLYYLLLHLFNLDLSRFDQLIQGFCSHMKTTQMDTLDIQLLISTLTEFRSIIQSELNACREMEENG